MTDINVLEQFLSILDLSLYLQELCVLPKYNYY